MAVDICLEGCSPGMVPPTCNLRLLCFASYVGLYMSGGVLTAWMMPPTCSLRQLCFACYGG